MDVMIPIALAHKLIEKEVGARAGADVRELRKQQEQVDVVQKLVGVRAQRDSVKSFSKQQNRKEDVSKQEENKSFVESAQRKTLESRGKTIHARPVLARRPLQVSYRERRVSGVAWL